MWISKVEEGKETKQTKSLFRVSVWDIIGRGQYRGKAPLKPQN